jgi:6-phosphogluconolactonase
MRARRRLLLACAAYALPAAAVFFACSDDAPNGGPDSGASNPDGATGDASTTGDGASNADGATQNDAGADAALGPARVFVGSGDGKVRVFSFDTDAGTLSSPAVFDAGTNPSFLAFDPTRRFVYAVDEGSSAVRAFAVDGQTGALSPLNQAPSGGSGPAHVAVDRAGGYVLVANYGGGTVSVIKRQSDGTLGASVGARSFGGSAQTHQIVADPQNAFLLVPNKGLDAVHVLGFNQATGATSDAGSAGSDDGARHIDFHPSGAYAYVINENASTMTAYTYANGVLAQLQSISTLPNGYNRQNTGAEVQVAPSGKFVYGSNRGHDSIVIFSINPADGRLSLVGHQATGGSTPRHFSIDRTGRFLLVGNQGSGTVVVMRVDAQTGLLTPIGSPISVPGPEWVSLVYL